MSPTILWLCAIVVAAQTVETVAGFGGTVIALSAGAHLLPLQELVVSLVLVGLLQSSWLVIRGFRVIDWRMLFVRILPAAGVGLALGAWVSGLLGDAGLQLLLGSFVVVVSGLELFRLLRRAAGAPAPLSTAVGLAVVVGGGFFHGLFATGGPMIVYFASRALPEKRAFRATLSALWLIMNCVLLGSFALTGRLTGEAVTLSAWLLPALGAGILLGELVHARVNELTFRRLAQAVLLCTGVLLLAR